MAEHYIENHGTAQVPNNEHIKVNGTPQPVSPPLVEVPQPVIEVPSASPANTEADVFTDYPRDEFEDNQPFYAELVQQVDPSQFPVVIGKPKERRFAAIHPESVQGEGVCGWILEGDGEGKKDDQKNNKPRRPDCRVATSVRNKLASVPARPILPLGRQLWRPWRVDGQARKPPRRGSLIFQSRYG